MEISCKVCDKGALVQTKVHRLSGPAVVIGYIFLIPSILGIIISALAFVQVSYLSHGSSGGSLVGGFVLIFGLASFVGGLLGWLLVMKKRVLRCNVCSATVNAA